jgi:hypothetical protein
MNTDRSQAVNADHSVKNDNASGGLASVFARLWKEPLSYLLLAMPLALALRWLDAAPVWIFVTSVIGVPSYLETSALSLALHPKRGLRSTRFGQSREATALKVGHELWLKIIAIVPPRGYSQPLGPQPRPEGTPNGEDRFRLCKPRDPADLAW